MLNDVANMKKFLVLMDGSRVMVALLHRTPL